MSTWSARASSATSPPGASKSLFPGYLFIRLDEVADNWHPIRSTRGVIQMVRFNEYPLPVADEIVESIREQDPSF